MIGRLSSIIAPTMVYLFGLQPIGLQGTAPQIKKTGIAFNTIPSLDGDSVAIPQQNIVAFMHIAVVIPQQRLV